jgi:reverse gyrase
MLQYYIPAVVSDQVWVLQILSGEYMPICHSIHYQSSFVAPTGSGKTVVFELAIIRMLQHAPNDSKCVYLAPTKVNNDGDLGQ